MSFDLKSDVFLRYPDKLVFYAYERLSYDEKIIYIELMNAILSFKTRYSDNKLISFKSDTIKKILAYIYADHPEAFWFENDCLLFPNEYDNVLSVWFNYSMDESEAIRRQQLINEAIHSYLSGIDVSCGEYNAVLKIYERIIKNNDYDSVGLDIQKQKKTNIPDDLRSICGIFINKKAVCAGYTKATQYLLNLLGIERTYVASKTHAWNLMKVEGEYYHTDTTWGDGTDTDFRKEKHSDVDYSKFCITTKELARLKHHTPTELLPLPECTSVACNYFYRNGLVMETLDPDFVEQILIEYFKAGKYELQIKYAEQLVFHAAESYYTGKSNHMSLLLEKINRQKNIRISTSYVYSKNETNMVLLFKFTKL